MFSAAFNSCTQIWVKLAVGNQCQSPHLHSEEAKSQLRVPHRAQPQAERREEGSVQRARDNGAR